MALTKISGNVIQSSVNVGVITASTINVGSAVTIHTGGFRVGSSDLHSGGLTVQNLNSTGVVTATTFSGNLTGNVTGNVTGNATGLSGTPNITVGVITAASAVITGNVSVAGTVTYEDTTNVDSIGVVTARSGVRVSAGSSVGIGTNNPAEQLELSAGSERLMIGANSPSTYSRIAARNTANSGYRGLQIDGSDLLINSNTSGNILACTGGGSLGIGTNNPVAKSHIEINAAAGAGSGSAAVLWLRNSNRTANNSATIFAGNNSNQAAAAINFIHKNYSTDEGDISFDTRLNGSTYAERLRITSSGNVGIGLTNPSAVLHIRGESGTTSTSDSPLYVDVPHNKISMFIGRQTSTSGFSDQTYSGNIRFNGSDVAWGDISYYPNGNSSTGSFRFTRNGSTVSSTPNARIGVGEIWMPAGSQITFNNGDSSIQQLSGYHLRIRTYDGVSSERQMIKCQGGTSGGHVTIGGDSLGPSNGFVPLHFASNKQLANTYTQGGHTLYIGQIAPGNSGNSYLHVKFSYPTGAMFYLRTWGYGYGGAYVMNSWCGGYHYGSSIISSQTYNSNGTYGIGNVYLSSDGNICIRIYANQPTGNAWGYYAFEGGFDPITGSQLDTAVKILAYTWTSSSANQY